MECDPVQAIPHQTRQRPRGFEQCRVLHGRDATFRQQSAAVLRDLGQGALGQVAKVVRELDIRPPYQRGVAVVAVIAERHLPQQEIPHGIEAERLDEPYGVDGVAQRLAHLLARRRPPAVRKHSPRRRQPGRH